MLKLANSKHAAVAKDCIVIDGVEYIRKDLVSSCAKPLKRNDDPERELSKLMAAETSCEATKS